MLLNKRVPIILFVIMCDFNKAWGKGHSHGHGYSGSRRSSSSSYNRGFSTSSHSHHAGNSAGRSSSQRKLWSSYSTDEQITSKPITSSAYDSFEYTPPVNVFNVNKPVTYEQKPSGHYTPTSMSINELENFLTGYLMGSSLKDFNNKSPADNDKSHFNYDYSQPYQPPIVIPPSIEHHFSEESKSQENGHLENLLLKSFSHNYEPPHLNLPINGFSDSLKVNCQKQLQSEFNERGEIVDNVKEICNPLTLITTTPQPTTSTANTVTGKTVEYSSTPTFKPYAAKEKRYERILTPKTRGINCRKVMNSEFNERGEIVDSVTEVCEPPPTTTTTTTSKPTIKFTTRRPSTTPKPLVKVCRRVMDSYLNEAGEIIDSVTEVCSMEPVN